MRLKVITVALLLVGATSAPQPEPKRVTKRLFENRVPDTLPIKVHIKREKERQFRDLNNENWARDLEIEVKNVGDKPIYTLDFALDVPEAKIQDDYQSFSLTYGRVAVANGDETLTAADVPIKPGETAILKLDDNQLKGWDQARQLGLVPAIIRGVRLIFQDLSFADGTGFEGKTGTPRHPRKTSKVSYLPSAVPYIQTSESRLS